MLNGTGMRETKRPSGFSIWVKTCKYCNRIKLLKEFPWYPMKIYDSAPRVMDACKKCAKARNFRIFDPDDFSPDMAFLDKLKFIDMHLEGHGASEQYEDRHHFNLGNGGRWIRKK